MNGARVALWIIPNLETLSCLAPASASRRRLENSQKAGVWPARALAYTRWPRRGRRYLLCL